jgi:hypothetical protein
MASHPREGEWGPYRGILSLAGAPGRYSGSYRESLPRAGASVRDRSHAVIVGATHPPGALVAPEPVCNFTVIILCHIFKPPRELVTYESKIIISIIFEFKLLRIFGILLERGADDKFDPRPGTSPTAREEALEFSAFWVQDASGRRAAWPASGRAGPELGSGQPDGGWGRVA